MTAKHHKPKRRKSARDIKKELEAIYADKDGNVPDMTKLETRGGSAFGRWMVRIILTLAVISAAAWGGFFLVTDGLFQEDELLSIGIDGPEELKSGEEVSYTFRYENNGDVPMASLVMKLNLPDSFTVYSAVPEENEPGQWNIGSLGAGSDGAITLTGVFLAEVPSEQKLQSLYTYKPANFSSEFQDLETKTITIDDSVIGLSFTGPDKALAGDVMEYVINVQNMGLEPMYNLRVTPSFTNDFEYLSAEPEIEEGEKYWMIEQLEPSELAAITIKGSFTNSAEGTQPLTASVSFVKDNTVYEQASEQLATEVLGGSLSYDVIINGSTDDRTAELGETLRLSIDYANNSTETIEDVTFELNVTAEGADAPINWSGASLGGGTHSGDTVSWSITSIDPQSEDVIDISLPILTELSSDDADTFQTQVTLTLNNVGGIESTRTLESSPIQVSLNSDIETAALARYYTRDGTQVGSGPIPLEVGQTSAFRIYWIVENELHTLEDVKMSTTLPSGIEWEDNSQTEIGNLSYNSTTRQVTWSIPKLLTELVQTQGWFEVSTTPSSEQIGQFVKLTNTSSFTATDIVTDDTVSRSMSALTTELIGDSRAEGEGIVLE